MNQLSFIKQVLYKLKRAYGYPVTVYRYLRQDVNVDTGAITAPRENYRIRKAVILPSALVRKFSYDLSYIAANKNFAYGGFYDVGTRLIVIDGVDLPRGFALAQEDYIVYERKHYVVKAVEAITDNLGFLVTAKELEGTPPFQILTETAESTLTPSQGAN